MDLLSTTALIGRILMQILLRNLCVSAQKCKMLEQFSMSIGGRKKENLDPYSNPDYTKADRIVSVKIVSVNFLILKSFK